MSTRKLKNRWTAGLLGVVTVAALCSMPTKAESACFGPSPEKATLAALREPTADELAEADAVVTAPAVDSPNHTSAKPAMRTVMSFRER